MTYRQIFTIAVIWIVFAVVMISFLIHIGNTNPDAQSVFLVSGVILFIILVLVPAVIAVIRYARNRSALEASGDPDHLGTTRFAPVIPQLDQPLTHYCAAMHVPYRRPKRIIFTTTDDSFLLFAVENMTEPIIRVPWTNIARIVAPKPAGMHGPARRPLIVAIRKDELEYRLPLVLTTVIGTTFISDTVVNRLLSKLNAHL